MGTVETAIAQHVSRSRFEDLPPEVVAAAKEKVLDTLGVMVAGSAAPGCDAIAGVLAGWGGTPESTIVVNGGRLPAPHAAQVHGSWAHADEFCDNDDRQALKASATVIPVALALAEARGASGKDLIAAAAVGIDLGCRIGLALNPQPASIGRDEGVFSGAAAGARILNLSEEGVLNALAIGYTQLAVAGLGMASPSLTKRLIPGQVNRAAAWAAVLAQRGFPAGREALQGTQGYYRRFRGVEGNAERLLDGLGERWEVTHCPKPYPSGRFTHHPIDAALALRDEGRFALEDVQGITITMSKRAILAIGGGLGGEDLAAKRCPRGVVDAQTSAPYTVAVALRKGSVTLADFTEAAIRDTANLALSSKAIEVWRPEFDAWPEFITPAAVEVRLRSGQALSKTVEWAKGNAKNPCSPWEMRAKFLACVANAALPLSPRSVDQAMEMAANLEDVRDIGALLRLLVSPRA